MKDPAFLFYPSDWLGGTLGMTFEQKGAYMGLLILQFHSGPFDENTARLLVGEIWNKIAHKFSKTNCKFYNERLKEEKLKRIQYSDKQRERIKKRWNKKDVKDGNTTVLPYINGNRDGNINSIENTEGGPGETKKGIPGTEYRVPRPKTLLEQWK
jgi:hypothetical protein